MPESLNFLPGAQKKIFLCFDGKKARYTGIQYNIRTYHLIPGLCRGSDDDRKRAARESTLGHEAHAALAQLSDHALKKMILELGHYALSVSCSKPRWRTENAAELPRGETVDSIVSLAFEKVLSGERHWDPQKEPDLKRYLMGVIDSLLSHLARHQDNRVLAALPSLDSSASAGSVPRENIGPFLKSWPTQPLGDPEAVLLHKERHEREAQGLQLLLDAAQDDPLVAQIIHAMRQGHHKAGEIAAVLGIAVTEVYNAMKRLDRKIVRVRQQVVETLAST